MIAKCIYCPRCGTKRIKRLTLLGEYYCPKCGKKDDIRITELPIDTCYKCEKQLIDAKSHKIILMGNGKLKHKRCGKNQSKISLVGGSNTERRG